MQISVVIASHNGEDTLGATLEVLASQTSPTDELIVVDDGSTDGTPRVVEGFPQVRYLRQTRSGPAAARNVGANSAKGEIVAFIDDDCIPPLDWVSRILSGYERYPEVACVGGPYRPPTHEMQENPYAIFQWEYERGMLPSAQYVSWLTRGQLEPKGRWSGETEYVGGIDCPAGLTGNVSYKLDVFSSLGGFDESFPLAAAEDADLKIRLCLAGHKALWLDTLVVEHNDEFSARKFRTQHLRYGAGVVKLEEKYRGVATPRWKAFLRLVKRLLLIPLLSKKPSKLRVGWIKYKASIFDALGQFLR